jgi:hypothetical protein
MLHSLAGCSLAQWKYIRPWRPEYGPEGKHFVSGLYFYFGGCSEAAMDGGRGAQRPVWGGNELKKMGARSARARTRGQNPLVQYKCLVPIYVFPEIKLCSLLISKTEL